MNSYLLALLSLVTVSCGDNGSMSGPDFIPVAGTNKAILEARDLTEAGADRKAVEAAGKVFLFSAQVVDVKDFHMGAYSYSSKSRSVVLRKSKEADRLLVVDWESAKELMAFNIEASIFSGSLGSMVVDFSTPQSLVFEEELRLGGARTSGSSNNSWVSVPDRVPVVRKVMQNSDMSIIDVSYFVSQNLNPAKASIGKSGEVTMRYTLVRRTSLDLIASNDGLVVEGYDQNIGFFPIINHAKERELPPVARTRIRKFNIQDGQSIVFYLKGFPDEYIPDAIEAVKVWNQAFGKPVVKALVAEEFMDLGDPRYNVIRWIKDSDSTVPWAGTAGPTFSDDRTGTIYSGGVIINGDSLIQKYAKIHETSQLIFGSLGGLSLESAVEKPVIPPATRPVDFSEYMRGYYYGTIAHEVGHVLGLMHNFKGNIDPQPTPFDEEGVQRFSNSLMEYLPRTERSNFDGPGLYDIQAIQWGYFSKAPNVELPFCTHMFREYDLDCLKGDVGNPLEYTQAGLQNMTAILTEKPLIVAEASSFAGTMEGQLLNALQIKYNLERTPGGQDKALALGGVIDQFCQLGAVDSEAEGSSNLPYDGLVDLHRKIYSSLKRQHGYQPLVNYFWSFLAGSCFADLHVTTNKRDQIAK